MRHDDGKIGLSECALFGDRGLGYVYTSRGRGDRGLGKCKRTREIVAFFCSQTFHTASLDSRDCGVASKKFKGKVCVYCGQGSSTGRDHVFAREFFVAGGNQVLPQVPACAKCNGEKATLEHYLTALLPFGGRHAKARENLETMVPPRLNKNKKLHHHLAARTRTVWARERTGLLLPTMTLPLDFARVEALFTFIVKGLVWYHWQTYLTSDHFVTVLALSQHGEAVFDRKFFQANARDRVASNLDNGTFLYEGVQGVDRPDITAWRFLVYGGATFGGDPRRPEIGSSVIGAFTGPRRVLTYAALRARYAPGI